MGAAGLIVKIIGVFFRIPLTNIIGTGGMGFYQMAYPVYSALLVVSTIGLPVAISKLVSERAAHGDYAGAHYVFQVAWRLLLVLGIATAVLMFALAGPISRLQAQPDGVFALMAISPALFFVAMMSAYRGYFQGLQFMVPTAVSQIIEQLVKVAAGLSLAYLFYSRTADPTYAEAYGAMGAMLGIALSELLAMLYTTAVYRRRKKKIFRDITGFDPKAASRNFKPLLKKILVITIPVTLGASIMPLVMTVDSVIVSRTLQDIGYDQDMARSMYGILTAMVMSLVNMPIVFSQALQMSIVPAVAESKAQKDIPGLQQKTSFGIRLALLIGIPAATAFFLLARPILQMLYKNSFVGAEWKLDMGTTLFRILTLVIILLTLTQTMMGILQGIDRAKLPVFSLIAGAGAKIVFSVVLIAMPEVNVYGAAISTVICYIITMVMDGIFVWKTTRAKLKVGQHILKPVLATAVMGACVYLVYRVLGGYSNTLGVLAAVVIGLVVYILMVVLLKGLTKEEMQSIPGGTKLIRMLRKMKVWR